MVCISKKQISREMVPSIFKVNFMGFLMNIKGKYYLDRKGPKKFLQLNYPYFSLILMGLKTHFFCQVPLH
jgi:hypothetical protein